MLGNRELLRGGVHVTGSVIDASGGPVAGALISAIGNTDPNPTLAVSTTAGEFVLTLPAGMTRITARAEGYSQGMIAVEAPTDGVQLILTPAASIRGRVLAEATRVPLADVEVTVMAGNGLLIGTRSAGSDASGTFSVDDLPAGGYSLVATAAAWRSSPHWVVLEVAEQAEIELLASPASMLTASVSAPGASCAHGTLTLDGPVAEYRAFDAQGQLEVPGLLPGTYQALVRCKAGLELREELQVGLEPLQRDWELTARGLSLTGRVTTASGAPLADALVQVDPIGEPASRGSVTCSSDARGAFTCAGLEPGPYACQLLDNAVPRSERVQVTLQEHAVPPSVSLRAFATARLRVHIENDGALQLDAFAVLAAGAEGAPLLGQRQGNVFVFEQLPLGVYDVSLEPEVEAARRRVALTGADGTLDVELSGLSARELSGRVVDENGSGVPDVWVRVAGASLYGALRPAPPVMSDAEGNFTINGLLPGTYALDASGSRGEARLDEVALENSPLVVRLRSFGSLSGSVTRADGAPVAGFLVTYGQPNTDTQERVSGYRGSWSVPWLAPGNYELSVTAPEGSAHATIDVAPGREASLVLSLAAPALGAPPSD